MWRLLTKAEADAEEEAIRQEIAMDDDGIERVIREAADTLVDAAPPERKSEVRAASLTFLNDVNAAFTADGRCPDHG